MAQLYGFRCPCLGPRALGGIVAPEAGWRASCGAPKATLPDMLVVRVREASHRCQY